MWIEKIRVQGGLLDGFEQELTPELNVIIGGRGTGKSSVIELIRFCLGALSYSIPSQKDAAEHALGVIGDGFVNITLSNGRDRIDVSRSAQDPEPSVTGNFNPPFVFSQSEIETIGLHAESRLALIDGFLNFEQSSAGAIEKEKARIHSITAEIRALLAEIDDITEKSAELPKLLVHLNASQEMRAAQTEVHEEIQGFRASLEEITPQLSAAFVRSEAIARGSDRLKVWTTSLGDLLDRSPQAEPWPVQIEAANGLADLRVREIQAINQIRSGLQELQLVIQDLDKKGEIALHQKTGLENRAREVRQQMEERQKGTSALEKHISDTTQQISALKSLVELKNERVAHVEQLVKHRHGLLELQDKNRQFRTRQRQKIVGLLNERLGPMVRLTVIPYSQTRSYVSGVAGALRGSGLRYNELSERIAETFSPTEIAVLAERRDFWAISKALEISQDRALRLCEALRTSEASSLFTTVVEDDINIELLDGADYKGIDFVSMGQRCTAILPIILSHTERIIILDQPEDHLDNAFIVNILVKALSARSKVSQTIVATHNPNIPVIGNADGVVQMDSDGYRCFIRTKGALHDPKIVEAITTIMEGGREAFARRATFYRENENNVFE